MGILEILDLRYVVLYFFIINLVGFLAMGIDKYKAQRDLWRIPLFRKSYFEEREVYLLLGNKKILSQQMLGQDENS